MPVNVLYIHSHDTGRYVQPYGHAIPTPNIQWLADQGIMPRDLMLKSPLANVLSSSIGGHQTAPVVTRLPLAWGTVHLLCSDGLTRHVSDVRIAERLGAMKSARQVCEDLLQDALDGGGTDNITVVV